MLYDYEEGTFVPTAEFATTNPTSGGITSGEGRYLKIGGQVTVVVKINNINTTGASGDLRIKTLPFTSLADSGDGQISLYVGSARVNNINYGSNAYLQSSVPDNTTYIRLEENLDNATSDIINTGNISDGVTDVIAQVTYFTAS